MKYPRTVGKKKYLTRGEHAQAATARARAAGAMPACCTNCGLYSDEVRGSLIRCHRCEDLFCGKCANRTDEECHPCAAT